MGVKATIAFDGGAERARLGRSIGASAGRARFLPHVCLPYFVFPLRHGTQVVAGSPGVRRHAARSHAGGVCNPADVGGEEPARPHRR